MGWAWGAGWLKFLIPPEKILRWVEEKGHLLQRVPHYVSVDQKTFGRYGVLPTSAPAPNGHGHIEMGVLNAPRRTEP
jgi:GPI-anchor transamidase subunit GAA1